MIRLYDGFWPFTCLDPQENRHDFAHLQCVAHANRFVVQKQKRKRNNALRQFCEQNGYELPGAYGAPEPSYDAEIKNTKKYDRTYPPLDANTLAENVEILNKYFGPLPGDSITVEEAISTFDLSTSMGFPFNLWYKTKFDWLCSNDLDYWFKRYQEVCIMYPNSYSVVFNSFLKMDEVRPVEKLAQGKVRQVNGPHFLFLLMQAVLFKKQNDHLKLTRKHHPGKIGINVFGAEMQQMWDRLSSFPWKVSKDVTAFDSCVGPAMFASLCLWRSQHASKSSSWWMNHCYKQVTYAPFVTTRGFIFTKLGGNVSGQWLTGEDNSQVNCILGERFYRSAGLSDDDHFDCIYGDDGAHGVSQKLDLKLMQSVFSEHGFELRDLQQSEKLQDIVFLQRVPILVDGTWLSCHADGRKALDSLYLLNEDLSQDTQFQRACGLRIAYFYNREIYWKIDAWCNYMLKHYTLSPSVRSCYLPYRQIEQLYLHYDP